MNENAAQLPANLTTSDGGSTLAASGTSTGGQRMRRANSAIAARPFASTLYLDPLRSVQGTYARYDCPDLAAVDGHLHHLRGRLTAVRTRSPDLAGPYRDDIDRLLDRRAWLTLAITDQPERPRPPGRR